MKKIKLYSRIKYISDRKKQQWKHILLAPVFVSSNLFCWKGTGKFEVRVDNWW